MRTMKQVLGYGEQSRTAQRIAVERAVAAERVRCAAVCREVAARHYCDRVSRSEGAAECAEAIERGEVGDG